MKDLSPNFGYCDLIPPWNPEAEEAVLGGILLDPLSMPRLEGLLAKEAFYLSAHQEIFQAAEALYVQGLPTDLNQICNYLNDHGLLEAIGGQGKLAQLVERTVSAINIDKLAALLNEKYLRRQIISLGRELAIFGGGNQAGDEGQSTEQLLELAKEKLDSLSQGVEDPDKGSWFALRRQLVKLEGLAEDQKLFKLQKLAEKQKTSTRNLLELQEAVEEEEERQRQLPYYKRTLDELNDFQDSSKTFDWQGIFHQSLYQALKSKADSDPFDFSFLVQPLLAAVCPFLGARIGLLAKEGASEFDHWIEYANLFTVTITPPSSGKSSAERAIFAPLKQLDRDNVEAYLEEKAEIDRLEQAWKAKSRDERESLLNSGENPDVARGELGKCRRLLLNEGSTEAIKRRISEQPELGGVAVSSDELLNFLLGLDKFSSANTGRTFALTAWNGPMYEASERVDEANSIRFRGQLLSLCGGIQPQKAQKVFDRGEDPDGLLSRFLIAAPDLPDNFEEWSEVKVSVHGLLKETFEKLKKLPGGLVRLSPEAHKLRKQRIRLFKSGYRRWKDENPAFAYFLGKMCSNLHRLALVLHCLEATNDEPDNFFELSKATMQRAAALTDFYCAQFRLMQAKNTESTEDSVPDFLFNILHFCKEKKKLTPSDVVNRWRRRYKKSSQVIPIFKDLAQLKPDLVELKGRNLIYRSGEQTRSNPIEVSAKTPVVEAKKISIGGDRNPIEFSAELVDIRSFEAAIEFLQPSQDLNGTSVPRRVNKQPRTESKADGEALPVAGSASIAHSNNAKSTGSAENSIGFSQNSIALSNNAKSTGSAENSIGNSIAPIELSNNAKSTSSAENTIGFDRVSQSANYEEFLENLVKLKKGSIVTWLNEKWEFLSHTPGRQVQLRNLITGEKALIDKEDAYTGGLKRYEPTGLGDNPALQPGKYAKSKNGYLLILKIEGTRILCQGVNGKEKYFRPHEISASTKQAFEQGIRDYNEYLGGGK